MNNELLAVVCDEEEAVFVKHGGGLSVSDIDRKRFFRRSLSINI